MEHSLNQLVSQHIAKGQLEELMELREEMTHIISHLVDKVNDAKDKGFTPLAEQKKLRQVQSNWAIVQAGVDTLEKTVKLRVFSLVP